MMRSEPPEVSVPPVIVTFVTSTNSFVVTESAVSVLSVPVAIVAVRDCVVPSSFLPVTVSVALAVPAAKIW